jgi:hypothetical protein
MSIIHICDEIEYEGKTRGVVENPLIGSGVERLIPEPARMRASNNWKGYRAVWAVRNDRLWLERIMVMTLSQKQGVRRVRQMGYADYPVLELPLFARWFTGKLSLQTEKPWAVSVLGRGENYDLLLGFERGVLKTRETHRRVPPRMRKLKGYIVE